MELHTGDIVFYSGTDLISRAIKFFTKSNVSHVSIVVSTEVEGNPDGVVVAEALNNGFVLSTTSKHWIETSCAVGRVQDSFTKTQRDKIRSSIAKMVGSEYDFIALLEILYYIFTKRTVEKEMDGRVICSEAVEWVYRDLGITLVDKDPEYVTPQDLYACKKVKIYKDFTTATKDL